MLHQYSILRQILFQKRKSSRMTLNNAKESQYSNTKFYSTECFTNILRIFNAWDPLLCYRLMIWRRGPPYFETDHGMFLEWWNRTKSLSSIWQHFSCLLHEGIPKIWNKLNSHDGFLSYLQNSTAKSAHLAAHFRGATGTARAPKPGKAPIMTARRRCRLLFFKIEVRPRPCRPYRVRRRCIFPLS